MTSNSTATATARSSGVSVFGLLGILFVALKLAGAWICDQFIAWRRRSAKR